MLKPLIITLACSSSILLAACSANSTGTYGQIMSYTNATIEQVEVVDMKVKKDNTTNTAIGAGIGAIAGQLIGHDSDATALGAGIGAALGMGASKLSETVKGMRLDVKTEDGAHLLLDQPYSCMFKAGLPIRIVSGGRDTQVQVLDNGQYVSVSPTKAGQKCY